MTIGWAVALKTIAANQAKDPEFTTVWIAAEQWVPAYAEMCGVDLSRIYVISTNIMEEAYDAVIQLVESKAVDCVVIDSLPALVPDLERLQLRVGDVRDGDACARQQQQ